MKAIHLGSDAEWREGLNPGIKRTVLWLEEHGFVTVDSGDGKTHECECDRDEAYVVIRTTPETLISESLRLVRLLEESGVDLGAISPDDATVQIQATFDPIDGSSFIDIVRIDDRLLFGE